MVTCDLRSITDMTKDGEWGKAEPFDLSVKMAVIRGTDFADARVGVLEDVPVRHIPEHIAARKRLQAFDILIETAGGTKDQPTGRTLFIKPSLISKSALPLTCASFARFIRIDRTKADPEYVFWLLQSLYDSGAIRQYHTQHTGVARFQFTTFAEREPLQLPARRIQERIASILSAYDDLLQNNTRRIKILEEMAQMLYREWFVNFRFPGHERSRFTNSALGRMPENWTVLSMKDVADVIDCLHSKKPQSEANAPGLLLQLFNIGDAGKLDMSRQYRISKEHYDLWTSRIEVKSGDCVVTNIGRFGAAAQIPEGVKAALGRDLTAIRPTSIGPTYLIEYLLSPYMATEVAMKKDTRVIMDTLNVKGIVRLSVPVPSPHLLNRFEDCVRPMRRRIELMMAQNINLRLTRDLLLPKLISGEIPVEAPDETAAELMEEIAQPA